MNYRIIMDGPSFDLKYYKKKKKCALCERTIETTIHIFCEFEITKNYYDKTIKCEFGPLSSIQMLYNPYLSNNGVKK